MDIDYRLPVVGHFQLLHAAHHFRVVASLLHKYLKDGPTCMRRFDRTIQKFRNRLSAQSNFSSSYTCPPPLFSPVRASHAPSTPWFPTPGLVELEPIWYRAPGNSQGQALTHGTAGTATGGNRVMAACSSLGGGDCRGKQRGPPWPKVRERKVCLQVTRSLSLPNRLRLRLGFLLPLFSFYPWWL
jgi:hypothetical protein